MTGDPYINMGFCRCGCGTQLTHLRFGAVWASESCRKAFLRGRAPANASKRRPSPSGLQVSYRKATDAAAALAMRIVEDNARAHRVHLSPDVPEAVHRLAEIYVGRALSSRARETLQQKQEAA